MSFSRIRPGSKDGMGSIGGEIEIGIDLLSRQPHHPELPLTKEHLLWLNTGRAALDMAIQDIVRKGGSRRVWLPAYSCQSVLLPFKAHGFQLSYYSVGQSLDAAEGLPANLSTDTFLYIHYFGKKNVTIEKWLEEIKHTEKVCFIIEDCVQASLNENVGTTGDYVVTSYRKFLSQPDGAVLGSTTPIEDKPSPPDESFTARKIIGKLLREHGRAEATFMQLFKEAEDLLDRDTTPRAMSWVSNFLMQRTDIKAIAEARRNNYISLLALLCEQGLDERHIVPIFSLIEPGEVPLGLPIRVLNGRRESLRCYLAAHRIFCPVHWPMGHLIAEGLFDDEIRLSREILTLSIDQRMTTTQLEHMVRTMRSFYDHAA